MAGGGFAPSLAISNAMADLNSDATQQWGFVELTKSASANTKSAWSSIGTVTTDCSGFILRACYLNNSGSDHGVSHDIGIGPSGSQVVLINNIVQGQPAGTALTNFVVFSHLIPIGLKVGTQVWIRSAVDVASSTPHVGGWITPIGGSAFHQMQDFAGVETLGVTGTGTGTVLTGGAGSKGSYVQLGTATMDYGAVFLCFDFAGTGSPIKAILDIAIGPGGSQQIIVPNVAAGPEVGFSYMDIEPIAVQVKAGTAIWARSCNLDGSTQAIGVTLYGIF